MVWGIKIQTHNLISRVQKSGDGLPFRGAQCQAREVKWELEIRIWICKIRPDRHRHNFCRAARRGIFCYGKSRSFKYYSSQLGNISTFQILRNLVYHASIYVIYIFGPCVAGKLCVGEAAGHTDVGGGLRRLAA